MTPPEIWHWRQTERISYRKYHAETGTIKNIVHTYSFNDPPTAWYEVHLDSELEFYILKKFLPHELIKICKGKIHAN